MAETARKILLSSRGRGWSHLEAEFLLIPAGRTSVPGSHAHRLVVHFGDPINASCQCDGLNSRRVQKHGDIDIIPAGLDGSWEDDRDCTVFRLGLRPALLQQTALDLDLPDKIALAPTFQLRDPQIETITWAIKAELEADVPSDPLYADALGVALSVRLLQIAEKGLQNKFRAGQTFTPRQKRLLVGFIESHLDASLSLEDLAAVTGLGVTHFKTLFRNSFDMPPHRYVIRCRVERARTLLLSGDMPMSQVAIEAGFAHQSHMAHWMRHLLGLTPSAILRTRR